MVVKLSDRVGVQWFRQVLSTTPQEGDDEIAVSNVGIIAAAQVIPITGGEPFIAVSMYVRWFRPHPTVVRPYIYSGAAAHHIMSDLSAFIGDTNPGSHRILAAGDMNNIYGATEDNRLVWYERDRGVFDRMNALGLEFLGPQDPAGHLAEPPPQGVREDRGTFRPITRGVDLRPRPRTSWTTCSCPEDSTTGSGARPSTARTSGGPATTAGY